MNTYQFKVKVPKADTFQEYDRQIKPPDQPPMGYYNLGDWPHLT